MRDKAWRDAKRYAKGMRRIKEDRAQHGNDHSCPCFGRDGKTFSRFADTPTPCSCEGCGNPRKYWNEVTRQEKKAPVIKEWEDAYSD